ncbi:protein FAR1-RELATED SEQUENCE 6-like [Coffea eugenioides]|uniref:protein FAR1-RELATED SEQUENCE 6-like n=1 Tax=Coffea eugenioides TaxID=49369 RepID=UPI000F614552|nr:protein FAR1-RELATED SEQUENCE 6-like [Coffea eugenioides]
MTRKCSTLEFEDRWVRLVNECGVVENEWVKKLYRRRRLWAEAYLRGHFFVGMRSTQRCEKMNAFLNEYLNEKMRLYEFFRSFDLAIAWLRHTESKAVHTSENTKPVLTTILPELEGSAVDVFTRNVFFMVRKHLNRQGFLISEGWSEEGGSRTYYYSKYGGHEISWRVDYDRSMEKLICSCMKFESKGIPCAHMFRVMVVEGMNRISKACISKRWTKGVYCTNNGMKAFVANEQLTQMARYGTSKSSCNTMCYYASYMDDAFNDLQQMFDKHSVDLKEKWIDRGYGGDGFAMDSRVMNDRSRRTFGLLDPRVSRCKGDHKHAEAKKKRKCGHCRIAQEDNRELRATVDAQTIRIHELETNVLEEQNRAEALREQLQEVKRRLVRVVHEIRGRTEGMMAECMTLVEQMVDSKILDKGQESSTRRAEDEVEPTEVVDIFGSTNH